MFARITVEEGEMFRRKFKKFILIMVSRLIYKKVIIIFNIMNKVMSIVNKI